MTKDIAITPGRRGKRALRWALNILILVISFQGGRWLARATAAEGPADRIEAVTSRGTGVGVGDR